MRGNFVKRVRVKQSQLEYFRRLARESPLEIQAYLVGEVVNSELTVIESFAYTKQYGVQTNAMVAWYWEDYNLVNKQAVERGKRIVGSIHSHPDWDAVMSPDDYATHVAAGSRICGICSTNHSGPNVKTYVRFWSMDSPLPCEIVYA
jgi:proteasome lid subunit RPN8/RPN11